MTTFLEKPFDDMEQKDIAIGFAEIFDGLARHFAQNEDLSAEGAAEWEAAMARSAAVLRSWAKFGAWYTRTDLRNVARHALFVDGQLHDREPEYRAADRAVREYLERGRI